MQDPQPIIEIVSGVGMILAAVGAPIAGVIVALVPGVSSILNGVFGIWGKKKENK